MSGVDVLVVMEGLCEVADEHQDEGPSGYGWASDKLCKLRAEGPEALAAVAKMIAVLRELHECAAYWSEYDVPIGIHDRIKDALAAATGESHE